MTRVSVYRDQAVITGFEIKGHAGFAPSGEDIVCAAISAIGQTCVLGLTEVLGLKPKLMMDGEKGLLRVALPSGDQEAAQLILKTMVEGLKNIQAQYPDYIRIAFRERR